jgi:D-serine deaminase-like pyridoxal phosphate-dependent protein
MTTQSEYPQPPLSLTKGLGPALAHDDPARLIGSSLFAADRDFPQLTLNGPAIAHNIEAMMGYVRDRGVSIAPHGKTAMSPQLAQQQLDAGAWGITAATPFQLRVYRAAGIPRLLLANQLVEPGAIAGIRGELAADPDFECLVYADSTAGLDLLADPAAADADRPLSVLLEAGNPGGRTGARDEAALRALAEHAARTPGIRVVGIATYEGTLGGDTPEESAARVVAFAENLGEIVGRLEEAQLVPADCTVSIGGSAYFDAAVDGLISAGIAAHRILLRSGAYLTHDDGFYSRLTPLARGNAAAPALRPAITVWAPVLSIPEPGLAIVLCGRRDVGFDQGMPVVHGSRSRDGSDPRPFSGTITQLADQHAFIQFDPSGDAPRVGDLVELGISHPCTTLDRWGLVPLVDDEARIVDLIRMHFA